MREKKTLRRMLKCCLLAGGSEPSSVLPILKLSSYGNVGQRRAVKGRGLFDCYSVRRLGQTGQHKTKMSEECLTMSGPTQYLPLGYFLILPFISSIYLVNPLRRTNNELIYKKINEPASRRHLHCSSALACRHRSWPQFHLCSSCRGI